MRRKGAQQQFEGCFLKGSQSLWSRSAFGSEMLRNVFAEDYAMRCPLGVIAR